MLAQVPEDSEDQDWRTTGVLQYDRARDSTGGRSKNGDANRNNRALRGRAESS
jgi:hypothetical protein